MRIAILGAGLVGRRAAEMVGALGLDTVLVSRRRAVEPWAELPSTVELRQGWNHPAQFEADLVVVATESHLQPALTARLIRAGVDVVTTADGVDHIERLLALDRKARRRDVTVLVGAACSPGLSTLLAVHLARDMTEVSTITTAQFGTGGPSCARQHHRAMGASAREVHEGRLRTARGGSGRELIWFPEPAGPADCYRAGLAEPLLLHRRFPDVRRIESRQAATRRDRLTSRLPMLRRPHAEGLVGATWAEVRGTVEGRVEHRAMAATGPQATLAAAMVAASCRALGAAGEDRDPGLGTGVGSCANVEKIVPFLKFLSTSMRLWTYDGSQIVGDDVEPPMIHAAQKWKFSAEIPMSATILPTRETMPGSFA